MTDLLPIMRDQRKIDGDHLRLLAIFHFVLAALALVGLGLLFLHYTLMHAVVTNPELWKNQRNAAPPPEQILAVFKWFYVFVGTFLVAGGIGNLLSGLCILRRKARVFSLIMAGFNCLQFPFGTVLSVFTFVVLLRDSVRESYAA